MAVTAVYLRVGHIFRGDGKVTLDPVVAFSNIAATTAAFTLSGGTYQLTVVGATFGTVTLQVLGGDGSTWLTAQTAFAANGTASVNLAPGSYRFALA
jgi:hypothetical protein